MIWNWIKQLFKAKELHGEWYQDEKYIYYDQYEDCRSPMLCAMDVDWLMRRYKKPVEATYWFDNFGAEEGPIKIRIECNSWQCDSWQFGLDFVLMKVYGPISDLYMDRVRGLRSRLSALDAKLKVHPANKKRKVKMEGLILEAADVEREAPVWIAPWNDQLPNYNNLAVVGDVLIIHDVPGTLEMTHIITPVDRKPPLVKNISFHPRVVGNDVSIIFVGTGQADHILHVGIALVVYRDKEKYRGFALRAQRYDNIGMLPRDLIARVPINLDKLRQSDINSELNDPRFVEGDSPPHGHGNYPFLLGPTGGIGE